MLAIPINEKKRLSRFEYWKRMTILFIAYVIVGAMLSELPDSDFDTISATLGLAGYPFQVYWGVQRCRDIGWHPAWAILNWSLLAIGIFGIPKSKIDELRLVGDDNVRGF